MSNKPNGVRDQRRVRATAAVKRIFYRDPAPLSHTWITETGQDIYEFFVTTGSQNDREWFVFVTVGDNNKVAGVVIAADRSPDETAWKAIRNPEPIILTKRGYMDRQHPNVLIHSFSGIGDARTYFFRPMINSLDIPPQFQITPWDHREEAVGGLPGSLAYATEFLWKNYVKGDPDKMTHGAKQLANWARSKLDVIE